MSSDVTNAYGNVHSVQPERNDMKEPSITNSNPVKVTLSKKVGDQRVVPPSTVTINKNIKIKSAIPKHRQQLLKWNGWGYKDSQFQLNEKTGTIKFTGNRYSIGNKDLPFFVQWARLNLNVNLEQPPSKINTALPLPSPDDYPIPLLNNEFVSELDRKKIAYSTDGIDRLYRSHGHSLQDIVFLRKLDFSKQRLPDLVVWPETHDDVVYLVNEANKRNIVIIPFGGGTSVSWAVSCPKREKRMCISLDTSQMNRMLWLDRENLVACFEAGIIGQDLERCLQSHGYTSGHEPDSYEFSSLGGWVATRASGMKKNTYGNIEDLIISVKMVTPNGVLFKKCQVPRLSCGPDFNHVILGSEGTLGVITEVAFKIRPLPKIKKYGSLVFPDFESGFKAIREVARQRAQPSSIRLMDNEQFKFGQSLKGEPGYFESFIDGIKKTYITKIKKFDIHKMCVATLLFEGDENDVAAHEKKIYKIASQFGGLPAGSKNGERGYTLTFVIAYIRDIALDYDIIAESFETSVPWDRALALCRNVKHRLIRECEKRGIVHYLVTHRITQSYDAGCCIYFYFGFNCSQVPNPLECYQELEDMARDEIIDSGGSLSHHHGVGKLRAKWYPKQVSEIGVALYQMTKNELDPKNIFANGNFFSQDCHM